MDFPSLKKRVRERLQKEWKQIKIAATALILAEGILAGYCIIQSQNSRSDFIKYNQTATKTIRNSVICTAYELPQHLAYKTDFNQISNSQISIALQNPKTIASIDALMEKDDRKPYTELQGIITHDYENGKAILRFYEIPTENGKVAKDMIANLRNKTKLEQIINENIDIICTVTKLEEKEIKQKLKNKEIQKIIYKYFSNTDNIAKYNWQGLGEFYHKNLGKIKGNIIGKFHTHNDASPPSETDVRVSKLERIIVLSREFHTYKLHDIVNGKIKKISVRRK